jgi:hypothetical protein
MKSTEPKSDLPLKAIVVLAMIASLVGCGGNGSKTTTPITPVTPLTTPGAASVYVIQTPATFGSGSGEILELSATEAGSQSPKSTITAPTNTSFGGLATDGEGNIYVAAASFCEFDGGCLLSGS